MDFTSAIFIFAFLPLTLILYAVSERFGKNDLKNVILLTASVVFYAWGGLGHFCLLVVLVILNYVFGLWIAGTHAKKPALAVAVVTDLAVLGFFKYFNFLGDSAFGLLRLFGLDVNVELPRIALPLGVSFFTFQIISYLVDVYHDRVPVQRNAVKLALYIMMFPKIVAGPIVRYTDIHQEIGGRRTTAEMLERGAKRFMAGFAKKILLANTIGKMVNAVFSVDPGRLPTAYAWLGILGYTLQIFLDFSSYSDMAIGLGWIFGFHFKENFDDPYVSLSIREFWRRWHISLSTWFRDYVYIPLGGSRRGNIRTYVNLLVVFFLTGLWHGSSWNFVCWGMFHGIFMLLERSALGKLLRKTPKAVQWLYTMLVVMTGWVMFRADSMSLAAAYIRAMFVPNHAGLYVSSVVKLLNGSTAVWFVLAVLACIPAVSKAFRKLDQKWPAAAGAICVAVFILALSFLMGEPFNPFIYVKF